MSHAVSLNFYQIIIDLKAIYKEEFPNFIISIIVGSGRVLKLRVSGHVGSGHFQNC